MKSNGTTPSQSLPDRKNLEITESQDDAAIRSKYRPFLLDERVAQSDWVSKLELDSVEDMVQVDLAATNGNRLRVLVIYGSLRARYVIFQYVRSHTR
jgi:arsenic resistance protein ArsH